MVTASPCAEQSLASSTPRRCVRSLPGISELLVEIPPLRERPDDALVLARHFLERFQREPGRAQRGLSAEAVQAVAGHDWPGNVRELENRVKRAVVVAEGQRIRAADLGLEPPSGEGEEASTRLRDAVRDAARPSTSSCAITG